MSLNLHLFDAHPADFDGDTLILGLFEDSGPSAAARAVDERCNGRIAQLVALGDASGKSGRSVLLHGLEGVKAARVLLVGLGESAKFDTARLHKCVGEAVRALRPTPARHALLTLSTLPIAGRDTAFVVRQSVIAAEHAAYRYTATRKPRDNDGITQLSLLADAGTDAGKPLREGAAIAAGMTLTRELGNLPPNICNPAYLADTGRRIASEHEKVDCEVLEREDMEKLGMGSLLAVSAGSANAPKLVVLHYRGGSADAKPYALVGKGITFDTGGISLKPGPGMEEMKFDMCGAAGVLGAFLATVKLGLPVNLVTVVAAVENMPDGKAYRPSDVLTSMSGKTIEVLNTDAEGRLILCDALTYVQRFEPVATVDVATLTGACVVALGKHAHGLMSRHDDLADELSAAGNQVHDRAWRLPIWDDYQPQIDSAFADVANIGGKWAGAITAGCFLARFTEGQRWAHLDIAGTAWDEGRKGLATGRPVQLLVQWLSDRAG